MTQSVTQKQIAEYQRKQQDAEQKSITGNSLNVKFVASAKIVKLCNGHHAIATEWD